MPYCTPDDVRRIIDTGYEDSDISNLIALADAEIDEREIDASTNVKRQTSMLIAASLLSLNDTKSRALGEYQENGMNYPKWRKLAEDLISHTKTPKSRRG